MKSRANKWLRKGTPWIWFNAGAVAISIVMVIGLLLVLTIRGMNHFWPRDVLQATYNPPVAAGERATTKLLGEHVETESVAAVQLVSSGIPVDESQELYRRQLMKFGNRDLTGADFGWVLPDYLSDISYPEELVVLERREWGNFYGFLSSVKESGTDVPLVSNEVALWQEFTARLERALTIFDEIYDIEKNDIGDINYEVERLRLRERRLELDGKVSPEQRADIDETRQQLDADYQALQSELVGLYEEIDRDSAVFIVANQQETEIKLSEVVRAYQPNSMNLLNKLGTYFSKLGEFLTDEPREANTEGGIFPAIFGTVVMVLLMSVFVTPLGVIAAVYLREYAKQGFITRAIRIAVNNLAGVPSIVYGVFGLGFFIYIIGGEIDQALYPEALPAPTFGTPGLLWASLTLALLTVPVVIVATEEGLARIPRSVREGSLALGATKFETIWRVVLPMASPAMMTGLILAIARAAGEVAPLMLVGVVKLAPALPVDGNYPYVHLDQKFMHLGFHIYDVGFQSPNVEAARPLVFATALLLVVVIALLNFSAVLLRNHLREKYKALDV
ncbi:MAG: phosphate ABC transporter, permease protein PstA [Gammaproteobacteria bacterium]|nr:phosphate ABC transporter, permease protein PstA [Gammaproteobacteria bacterium]